MRWGTTAVILGDGDSAVVTGVEEALEGMSVRITETVEELRSQLVAADCVVATSVESAQELLERLEDELSCPVVVLTTTGDAPLEGHEWVRHHRAADLETLNARVCDAVRATRAQQRTADGELVPAEELVEGESTYRTLVENIPNGGVALFDRDLRYNWVGGEVFTLVDLDPEDVAGKTIEEVHSEPFVNAYADTYRGVFDGERSTVEFSYDGREFQLDVVPVYDDDEVVAGMTMTRDVTADRERQRDLAVRTRAMDAAAIGLCLTDPSQEDNPLVYVNQGYERMTGYDAEEVLGKNPRHLTGPETEPDAAREMREAVENVEQVAVDVTNYRKDGTPFVNHVEITPIFDDEGELVHFLGSQVDVTERYDRERTLARQNERLEEFTSIVSHDLRSPLAVARGRLGLAKETAELSHITHAEQSLDRASELIDDLLALAREGRTIDPSRIEEVSLGAVTRDVWETVETAGATLTVDGEVTVTADESRLRQLFSNLFRNSVEHASTDGPDDVLEISVGPLADDCGFFVEDNGPGVPERIRDRVFDAGVTTADDGTGFGLAIVRSVAEAHGWEVSLVDTDHGGARFECIVTCRND